MVILYDIGHLVKTRWATSHIRNTRIEGWDSNLCAQTLQASSHYETLIDKNDPKQTSLAWFLFSEQVWLNCKSSEVYNMQEDMNKLLKLFHEKPFLAWYVKDVKNISKASMLEHILNYGDWDDYLHAEDAFGIKNTKDIFNDLKSKPRTNLRRKTINYFDKYFQRYA